MTDVNETQSPNNMVPIKIAFIIDNKVVEVLNTDERISAILLSNPLIMDVTEKTNNPDEYVMIGSTYNPESNTFEYGEGL
jgi:hypothetical protein